MITQVCWQMGYTNEASSRLRGICGRAPSPTLTEARHTQRSRKRATYIQTMPIKVCLIFSAAFFSINYKLPTITWQYYITITLRNDEFFFLLFIITQWCRAPLIGYCLPGFLLRVSSGQGVSLPSPP